MRQRLGAFALELLPFCCVFFVGDLYFKYSFLNSEGFDLIRSFLQGVDSTPLDWAGLYAGVLLESFLLPLFLLPLAALPARWRPPLLTIGLELVFLIEIAAWMVYNQIGSFPTLPMVRSFLEALHNDPALVQPGGLETMQWIKFAAVLAGPLGALLVARQLQRRPPPRRVRALLAGLWLAVLAGTFVAAASVRLRTNYHSGHLLWIASELVHPSGPPAKVEAPVEGTQALYDFYQQVAFPDGVPPPLAVLQPAQRPNILLVVLETAGADDYPLEHMPRVAQLARRGLVARRHYSSSAFSVRADFTLYTSVYDGPDRDWLVRRLARAGATAPPSLPRILSANGYVTHLHFPGQFIFPIEEWMVHYMGFDEVVTQGDEPTSFHILSAGERLAHERELFQRAATDLRRLCSSGQPFFVAVRSMIGHSPLISPVARSDEEAATYGRKEKLTQLAALLDDKIARLLGELEACGALERTIVLVTGDHGPRSHADDPQLERRFLAERTFHVPFVLYYPPAFGEPASTDYVTSHLDVTPTILALAGIDPAPFRFQGRPLFDPAIRNRRTMFLAMDLAQTAGLHYRGHYYTEDEFSGLAFLADGFRFTAKDRVDPTRGEAARFSAALQDLRRVEAGWFERLSSGADAEIAPAGDGAVSHGRSDAAR